MSAANRLRCRDPQVLGVREAQGDEVVARPDIPIGLIPRPNTHSFIYGKIDMDMIPVRTPQVYRDEVERWIIIAPVLHFQNLQFRLELSTTCSSECTMTKSSRNYG